MNHLSRNAAGHRRATPMDLRYCGQNLHGWGSLQQITVRPRLKRLKDRLVILMDGEHEDRDMGAGRLKPLNALDTGNLRQIDVHQHDVGGRFLDALQRVFSGWISAAARKSTGALDQHTEAFTYALVVFNDRYGRNSFFR